MAFILRHCQDEAVDALLNHWADGGGDALVEMATGVGKALVGADLARRMVVSGARVGILTHVRELVRQNFKTLLEHSPETNAGVYAAGLNSRDVHKPVTFASIQSIYKKAHMFPAWDLLLIDEAHLLGRKNDSMYRKFIEDMRDRVPHMRVGGLTATPYRLGEGRLDQGEGRLFEKIVYRYGIVDGINDGYLVPLLSPSQPIEIDVSKVGRSGGDFAPGQLEGAAIEVTEQALLEVMERGRDRHSWLIFCSGVKHAYMARDFLRAHGISTETVVGETPKDQRDRHVANFKAQRIRALTGVNALLTGFDAPDADLLAMLFSTLSKGKYIQCVGRVTRKPKFTNKADGLVLDFGGNIRRHGPVDCIVPDDDPKKKDDGKAKVSDVRAKECPSCGELVFIAAQICKHCDYEWPREAPKPSHDAEADLETPILTTQQKAPKQLPVTHWDAARHTKFGMPDSMRVTITAGVSPYSEWIAFEHGGYATIKAQKWWMRHGGQTPFPRTTEEALERFKDLRMPAAIAVKPRGKYFDIVDRWFDNASDQEAA